MLASTQSQSFGYFVLHFINHAAKSRRDSCAWEAGTPHFVHIARALLDVPTFLIAPGCIANYFNVNVKPCVFGSVAASMPIVLFGDSHAEQCFPALESIVLQKGWRLVPTVKQACAPADAVLYSPTTL
jgi:hypothetical protein